MMCVNAWLELQSPATQQTVEWEGCISSFANHNFSWNTVNLLWRGVSAV